MASKQKPESPVAPNPINSLASPRLQLLLVLFALVTITLVAYEPTLRNAFVNYDDPDYVTSNYYVLQGLSWHNILWAFTATSAANWHPLTWISHMVDVQLFGLNPAGHHLVNLLLHLANVVLLFLLLRYGTDKLVLSAAVAALFALCPLNVEAVAWIAERKSLLSTIFLLLALFSYGWYVRRPSVKRYLLLAFLFALGLMAKAMIITLPFLLLLIDYWPLGRFDSSGADQPTKFIRLAKEKIPLLFLSAGSALMTMYAAHRSGSVLANSAALPLWWRIKNALYSYLAYILKGLWPAHLAVFYPHPENSLESWKVAGAVMFLLAISFIVWRYRRKKYLVAGWLWYLVALVPVIGIVQAGLQAMADRYAYISFLGLFVMVVWLVGESTSHNKALRAIAAVAALATLAGYAYTTYIQAGYWRNSYTLFAHTLQVTKNNGIAEDNFGVALEEMGRPDLAISHFENAIRWMPRLSTAHYNLGTLLHRQNQLTTAMNEYALALQYCTDPVEAARIHNNRGAAFTQLNQPKAAISEFGEAIRINPNEGNSFLGRGLAEYGLAEVNAAQDDFYHAAQIAPSANSWYWLGRTLEDKREFDAATKAYENALQIMPKMEDARAHLDEVRLKAQK